MKAHHLKLELNVDNILVELGTLGRYQVLQYFLLGIIVLLTSSAFFSYIFTTGRLDYRCKIPECDRSSENNLEYLPEWLQFAVPFEDSGKPASCQRFQFLGNHDEMSCNEFSFNHSVVANCNEFVFAPGEVTIVNEFNITCQDKEWQLALVGSLGYMAKLVVLPLSAVLSDKYGRRPVLIANLLLGGVFGLIKSCSVNYVMFATMEFLTAFVSGGTYMTVFIMAIESSGPSHRVLSGTIVTLMFSMSQVMAGLVAMWVTNFRILLRFLYIPHVLALTVAWMVPESIRWLVTNGKTEKAKNIIIKAANINNIKLSKEILEPLANNFDRLDTPVISLEKHLDTFVVILQSRTLLIRLIVTIFIWFMIKLIYFGMTVQSVALAGNKHYNYIAVSGVEVPANLISFLLMNWCGRKQSLCVTLLLTGIASFATNLIPDDTRLISSIVYIFGKSCITTSFAILYVYSSELFPTSLRHSTMNTCLTIGTFGAILAPFTMLLLSTWPSLPLHIFGASALFCGALTYMLPETLNTRLPDTIAEAEKLSTFRNP